MTRLAIATCAEVPDLLPDEQPLVDHLRSTGLEVAVLVWTNPSVDWSRYDAVLIRSTWDYHTRYEDFIEWLRLLGKAGAQVFNDTDLVRWNSDKRYLLELRELGVSIVPTQVAAGPCLREVVAGLDGQDVVIKPVISTTAHNTIRGVAGSPGLDQAVDALPEAAYLVQPFQPEIVEAGELSLVFFDGEYSHAVVKRPTPGDYRVQPVFGGRYETVAPPAEALAGARATLAATPGELPPLYARVDGIVAGGRFLLMEIELIEPNLFLPADPGACGRFAAAVNRRINQA